MKRKLYIILMVLFILSACQPSPAGQGHAATATQMATATSVPTHTIEPALTIEIHKKEAIKINPEYPKDHFTDEKVYEEYSPINLQDFINGNLLKAEKEYLQTHTLFTDEAVSVVKLYKKSSPTKSLTNGWSYETKYLDILLNVQDSPNPNARPIKIFSYTPLLDFDLLRELGYEQEVLNRDWTEEDYKKDQTRHPFLWIVSWGYLNPDRTTTIGHTFLKLPHLESKIEKEKEIYPDRDFKFVPAYAHENVIYSENNLANLSSGPLILEQLFEKYPNLKPEDEYIDNWANSGQMPPELEKKIFTLQGILFVW